MKIEAADQETTDFDWFGVDEDGFIGHFTSAGFKRLPKSVENSAEDLTLITDYFNSRAETRNGHKIDAALAKEVPDWKGEVRILRDSDHPFSSEADHPFSRDSDQRSPVKPIAVLL